MDISSTPLSGSTYSLAQLLGGDLSMVIPAMQRDYCWGADGVSQFQPRQKVTAFIKGLLYMYINDHPAALGLLYGYANPPGSSHIHIIDGQQRLTTLYLLIGMLYRRTPTDDLRRMLISDYAMIDDREPALIYQTRNEAMYFMSDLVMNFFLNRDGRLSMLEKSSWYCRAYDSDATVQAFISALRLIDSALEEADLDAEWDFGAFAYFVTNKLYFQFYDLGSRSNAEEMFITINTTGEPLTRPQNIKAMLYALAPDKEDFIERWEEMEQWFWTHRRRAEGVCETSDEGLDRLLDLWLYMNPEARDEKYREDTFDFLYEFFQAYSRLAAIVPEALAYKASDPKDLFLLMPMLAYISRWEDEQGGIDSRDVLDFHSFLKNVTRYVKPAASGADMSAAIDIVEMMPSPALLSLADVDIKQGQNRILNQEEMSKLRFINWCGLRRDIASEAVTRAEEHPMLCGKCARLISWCTRTHDGDKAYDLDQFIRYVDTIYEIWGTDIDENEALDDLRRALLTIPSSGFPIVRRGETQLSLCWNDYDWQRLMANSPGTVRQLLDRVIMHRVPAQVIIEEMATKYTDRSNPYFFLIKSRNLLSQCRRRTLSRPCPQFLGIGDDTIGATRWFIDQIAVKYDLTRWTPMRTYGTRCIYTDHRRLNLAVDVSISEVYGKPFAIKVFERPDADQRRMPVDLPRLIEMMPCKFRYEDDRYAAYFPDASSAVSALHAILKNV